MTQPNPNDVDPTHVEADEKSIELTRKLKEARDNSKKWGEVADYYKDESQAHLEALAAAQGKDPDEVKAIVAGGTTIMGITDYTREVFDKERFQKEHPEIDLDDFKKVVHVHQLRPKDV